MMQLQEHIRVIVFFLYIIEVLLLFPMDLMDI